MIKMRIAAATLLLSGIGFSQDSTANPIGESSFGEGIAEIEEPFVRTALQEVLSLNDSQTTRLAEINFALEDEVFPLIRETLDKVWELRRETRAAQPNEAMVLMFFEDLTRIFQQIESVTARHRAMARSILSSQQQEVLVRLEEALDLAPAAREAIDANLIADPGEYPDADPPLDLFGLGGIEEIFGLFGTIPVGNGSATSDQVRGIDRHP